MPHAYDHVFARAVLAHPILLGNALSVGSAAARFDLSTEEQRRAERLGVPNLMPQAGHPSPGALLAAMLRAQVCDVKPIQSSCPTSSEPSAGSTLRRCGNKKN